MECAKNYQLLVTTDGKAAFILPAQTTPPGKKTEIIYNGGNSALLYRSTGDVLVLDNLHPKAQELLKTKQSVVIIETDYNTRQTIYDYQTTIHFHE